MDSSAPFGVNNARSFVVLDKSFLDGVNSAQLQCYARQGWIFGITEVLFHEHFRKRDGVRKANLHKLHSIETSLRMLPSIGEMFRSETDNLQPSPKVMRAKYISLPPIVGPLGEYYELDAKSLKSVEEREAEYQERCSDMITVWREFESIPELKNAGQLEMPATIANLSAQIRDDHDDMRGVYGKHRHANFPDPVLLDTNWAFFRWIQVQLLGGLGYYASYGVDKESPREKLMHELFDLTYLISALLIGGLACRDNKFIDRYRLLRPDGVLLRN